MAGPESCTELRKGGRSREEGAGWERDKDFFPDLEGEGRRLSWKNTLTVLATAPGSSGPPCPAPGQLA